MIAGVFTVQFNQVCTILVKVLSEKYGEAYNVKHLHWYCLFFTPMLESFL